MVADLGCDVFVLGALHLDVVVRAPRLPLPDETLPGSEVRYDFGGKGGNQAVAAARHGAAVEMAGRVGDDGFADALLARLAEAGVEARQVRRTPGASGMSVAIEDAEGNYGAVIVSGANLAIDAGEIALPARARALLLQNEIPEAANLALARAAKAQGARVILNAAPARPTDPELLALTDLLIVNRVEAAMLAGDNAATPAEAAARLGGGCDVIVTVGAEGALWTTAKGERSEFPAMPVEVVSTHGAGDAFAGALAARLAAGDDTPTAIAYAQAAAALHVSLPVKDRAGITPARVLALLESAQSR